MINLAKTNICCISSANIFNIHSNARKSQIYACNLTIKEFVQIVFPHSLLCWPHFRKEMHHPLEMVGRKWVVIFQENFSLTLSTNSNQLCKLTENCASIFPQQWWFALLYNALSGWLNEVARKSRNSGLRVQA